jgi:hypothetical protein
MGFPALLRELVALIPNPINKKTPHGARFFVNVIKN